MKKIYFIIFGILIISSFACNKQDWDREVDLPIRLESDMNEEVSINNDILTVNQAKLVISSITISGKRLQANDVTVNYNSKINLDFLSSEELGHSIKIPVGTYEDLKATIIFSGDSENNFILGDIVSNNGNGNGNGSGNSKAINIPLNFGELQNISIVNEQGESVVLIDEKTIGFKLTTSIQKSFDNLNTSMWQGLMNANQNQSQIDLNSTLGSDFQSSINSEIKNNIQLKVLK